MKSVNEYLEKLGDIRFKKDVSVYDEIPVPSGIQWCELFDLIRTYNAFDMATLEKIVVMLEKKDISFLDVSTWKIGYCIYMKYIQYYTNQHFFLYGWELPDTKRKNWYISCDRLYFSSTSTEHDAVSAYFFVMQAHV